MHDDVTRIGSVVRSAREAKGLTQAALADLISVSVRTVIAMEKNNRNPIYVVLYRLVHALNISADLILFPERAPLETESDQFVRDYLACGKREKRIITATFRSFLRELRHDAPEKQD